MDELHVGEAEQGVVAEGEERLDRIGFAVGHGAKRGRRRRHVAAGDQIGVAPAPDPQGRLFQGSGAAIGEHRMGIGAQLLGLLRFRQRIVQFEVGFRHDVRMEAVQQLAAGNIEIAADGAQGGLKPDGRGRVALLVGDRRPRNDRRRRLCIKPCGFRDPVRRDARDLRNPFQRKLVDALPELIESRGPALHEIPVPKAFVQNDLEPS